MFLTLLLPDAYCLLAFRERTDYLATSNKKQTFLGGAAVLAVATALVKIIGAIYKIPLNRLLGPRGFGYFNTAYEIYSILLMISTTGLPVAMSRMISEAKTLGQTRQIRQIYRTSAIVFLLIGAVGTGGMMALCLPLAHAFGQVNSWFAILCLSPSVLFICLISTDRGYFQGQSNMMPTSISQVMEAVCKLVVGLVAAYVLKKLTGSMVYAAGGAILGVTSSTLLSAVYLKFKHRQSETELQSEQCLDPTVYSRRSTVGKLLTIAIPITIGAAGLQLITAVDTSVYMHRLLGPGLAVPEKLKADTADYVKGIYNFCQTVFNMPCAFITPLTISAIPAITEQLTLRRRRAANTVAESAIRVMSLISMPCSVGLIVLARPIMQLLGGYSGADLTLAARLMQILGTCVFFNSLVLVLNAVMQAHGFVYIPVINMVVGGIARLIVTFILVGNPKINITGAAISTLSCYALISVLNIFSLRRVLSRPPRIFSNLYKPAIASVIMGGGAWLLVRLTRNMRVLLQLGVSMVGAVVIYVILVLALRIITADDCKLLPKGDKIAKILRIH